MQIMNEANIKHLKQLTSDNMHGVALAWIANMFRLDNELYIFNRINQIHDKIGYIPQELNKFRERMAQELLSTIRDIDIEEWKLINQCL